MTSAWRRRGSPAPTPQHREIYDLLNKRVYREVYARLKPLYLEIKKIAGYPRLD